jgi:hypothetical protein
MEQNKSLDLRIEETLNSLDGLQKASPGPFFYTRVMARMEAGEKNLWEVATAFITKPFVIASVICVVLLLNVTAVFRQAEVSPNLLDQADISLVDEYKIASTSLYDYTNAEP